MEFNKRYNRTEFVDFLQYKFLPEDFVVEATSIDIERQTKYIRAITKLGSSKTLDLVVYEVRHNSTQDARVGLSKEAFRFLADEWEGRALVLFVPENSDANYRFSLITIDLNETEEGRLQRIYSNPRRYSYYLGEGIAYYTPNKYLNNLGRVANEKDLTERFSVEVLTKAFYQELSDWYAWAVKNIRFPNKLNDKNDDDKYNAEAAIRLVTRLIFVWFLKQKQLIPKEFFDEEYIRENLIEDFNPNTKVDLFYKSYESKYYKAILQNLFFAMLNSPITKEGDSELSERHFRSGRGDYDNNKLMRYETMFKNPQLFIDLANRTVPFLNGGLFDCLDDKDNKNYVDGFSDREEVKKSLVVPDYLFFGEEVGKNIDLSEWYGDKKKKRVSACGIIDILKRYNFTVEENTPFDQEVSLDPELLGKVFENLLASYNPETQTTARKQTGSFYTPRDIVQYMVDESLVAHLKRIVGEELEAEYRKLISYVDEEDLLTDAQKLQVMEAIYHCKILDPACGSGAFPVGMLQQMVHILSKLDPTNEQWRKMMLDKAVNESRTAFQAESREEREERLKDIENSFDENLNNPDYARKLYLIENCIYGVDIQPIAIQISKLRFFISLVVDQKTTADPANNFGIRPLPNLEAKFVAANSLIPLEKTENNLGRTPEIIAVENELREANHKIFSAKTVRTKRKWKERLIELRTEMAEKLANNGFLTTDAANQLASWDMFNQNTSAEFFDAEWMFGVKDGFDVVIANPPYVLLQNTSLSEHEKEKFADIYSVAQYKVDLYHLFIEKGYRLLTNRGFLCYINPSNFLTNNYTDKLRYHILTDFCINFIINIVDDVFDARVNTCILGLIKNKDKNSIVPYYKGTIIQNGLQLSLLSNCIHDTYLKNIGYVIQPLGDSTVISLLNKIEYQSSPLRNFASVNFGMQLRNRKIFPNDVLQNPLKEELSPDHRKCITGKDIHEWYATYCNRYCYYNRIAKCGGCWDENIHNASIKILVRQVGTVPVCGIETNGFAVLNSAFIIIAKTINPYILLGLINSKLLKYYWSQKFEDKRKTFPKIKGTYLELIPIRNTNNIDFTSLVQVIVEHSMNNLDVGKDIVCLDKMVYHLYNLTYNEVLIVDPETPITREEYEKAESL
ncbi:Eco57I restriction-modification methylase domain-containing protein [Phocaeicola sartorii]|uniref:Eco57I restriction-modification methylase domain-containing protein n=1 Tax=Phocaeicola sartorii TaxID=671267 RepID=UPI0035186CE8